MQFHNLNCERGSMDFQERYLKHKTAIQKRWEPILTEVLLQEEPEKKISILKKAKQQAAKGIQDPEEQLSFLEHLDNQLIWYEGALLKQNGSTGVSQVDQSIETLNTDESRGQNTGNPVEKINWKGTQTQLAYLVRLLMKNSFLEHGEHWKMITDHYTVKGKQIGNQQIATAIGNVENYNKEGKPIKAETLESIVKEISSLKD